MKKHEIKAEIDYRLSKWIVTNLQQQGLLSEDERNRAVQFLLEICNPPTSSVEKVVQDE